MGIRFLCENCQKRLNVKVHQAGKKGRCPECGEQLIVPMQSTIAANEKSSHSADEDEEVEEQKTTQFTQTQRFDGEDLGIAATQTKPSTSALDSFTISNNNTREGESDDSITLASSDVPEPNADSFMLGKPVNPALQPGGPDPIEEDPNKVWYIRHAKDGETGPIRGKQLREMLDEGKVKQGSVIWREDWQDWEKVGAVFAGFEDIDKTVADQVFSDPNYPLPNSKAAQLASQKRIRRRVWLTVAIVVGVVTISSLIYLLIRVLS